MKTRTVIAVLAALFVGSIGAGMAGAQQKIWSLDSSSTGDLLGWSRIGPDLDGDQLPELLISASYGACGNPDDGYVAIVSTRAGELHRWCGSGGPFGVGEWVGDVDGGGIDDVAICDPFYYDPVQWGRETGRVQIYSTESKQLVYEIIGGKTDGRFGSRLASLDDVDNDGVRDLLIASPTYGYNSEGQLWVYSMKLGTALWTRSGGFQHGLASRVSGLGDVDGDGVGDCAASAVPNASPSYVVVYSGTNGNRLLRVDGVSGGDSPGASFAAPSDLDGDGIADVMFGGSRPDVNGYFEAYSVVTGLPIWRINGVNGELLGADSCAVGDINHDGFDDFLVTASRDDHDGKDVGRVDLISGRSHRSLFRFYAGLAGLYAHGTVLTRGADFDGDGFEDLVIGTYNGGKNKSQGGHVAIYAGNDLFLQADPKLPDTAETVTVDLRGGEPFRLGLIALTALDGVPHFAPLVVVPFDANGEIQLVADIDPSVSGHDFAILGFAEHHSGRGPLMVSSKQVVSVQ